MSSTTTKPKPLNVNRFQHSLLCCLISEEDDGKEEFTKFSNSGEIVDRVEQAFRKFDLDRTRSFMFTYSLFVRFPPLRQKKSNLAHIRNCLSYLASIEVHLPETYEKTHAQLGWQCPKRASFYCTNFGAYPFITLCKYTNPIE